MTASVYTGDPDWTNYIDGVDVDVHRRAGTGSTTDVHAQGDQPRHVQVPAVARRTRPASTSTSRASTLPNIIRNGDVDQGRERWHRSTVFLTVPSMPTSVGVSDLPADAPARRPQPAFALTGWTTPVTAHPDDRSDDMPITVSLHPGTAAWPSARTARPRRGLSSRCRRTPTASSPAASGSKASRSPKHHVGPRPRRVRVPLEEHRATGAAPPIDPTQQFRAGFNFRSTTVSRARRPARSDVQSRFDQALTKLPVAVRPTTRSPVQRPVEQDLHRQPRRSASRSRARR